MPQWEKKEVDERFLGPVVQRPISINPGSNFYPSFFIPSFKSLFWIIFSFLFIASNF